jgi:hypothetical protein
MFPLSFHHPFLILPYPFSLLSSSSPHLCFIHSPSFSILPLYLSPPAHFFQPFILSFPFIFLHLLLPFIPHHFLSFSCLYFLSSMSLLSLSSCCFLQNLLSWHSFFFILYLASFSFYSLFRHLPPSFCSPTSLNIVLCVSRLDKDLWVALLKNKGKFGIYRNPFFHVISYHEFAHFLN